MIGRAWAAYLQGQIDAHRLFNLCDAIRKKKLRLKQAVADLQCEAEPQLLSHVHPTWTEKPIRYAPGRSGAAVVKDLRDWQIISHLADCELLTPKYRGGGSMGEGGGLMVNETMRDLHMFLLQ